MARSFSLFSSTILASSRSSAPSLASRPRTRCIAHLAPSLLLATCDSLFAAPFLTATCPARRCICPAGLVLQVYGLRALVPCAALDVACRPPRAVPLDLRALAACAGRGAAREGTHDGLKQPRHVAGIVFRSGVAPYLIAHALHLHSRLRAVTGVIGEHHTRHEPQSNDARVGFPQTQSIYA